MCVSYASCDVIEGCGCLSQVFMSVTQAQLDCLIVDDMRILYFTVYMHVKH